MFTEAQNHAEGLTINHTPSSALSAGQMLKVGGRAAFACEDIAASAEGAVQVQGLAKIAAGAVIGNVGDNVWWDDDGSPYGGVAGSGCATTNAAVGDFWIGILAKALTATDGEAIVALNEVNPELPPFIAKVHELKSDNYTVDAEDMNKVLHIATDAKAFTLPTMSAGYAGFEVTFQNDGADGANSITINPNSNDKIMGPDLAGTDNKDYINTKATAVRGDYVTLRGDGTNGWWIVARRGTWASE
jgi:predicted RecA/RadA family phage recombinase